MTELNHRTFDLAAVLSGIGFPENTVTVYLDERVGFEIYKAEQALRQAEIRGNEEALKKIADELDALKTKRSDIAYKVTVRGISEAARKACDTQARAKYPVEYNFMGQATPEPARDDFYNHLLWNLSLVKFEATDGSVALLNEDLVTKLRGEAGRTVFSTIVEALKELETGTKSGFEASAQDVDFLSEA